jgi:alcohol dehydrogenase
VLCDTIGLGRARGILANGNRKLSRNGEAIYHYSGVSSFAQYAVTLPNALVKIDPAVPLDVAGMLGCAVLTGAGSVFNSAQVKPGQNVAIFGLGGVGLNAVMAARISGASTIVGIDLHESKFSLALELGCTHVFSAMDASLVESVRDLTGGGVDFAFEMSGARSAMASAHALTRKGAEIVCVGVGASAELYQYAHAPLVAEEKVLRGSHMGGGVPAFDIARYIRFYQEGKMAIDRLKSSTMTFDQLNLSLDQLDRGEVIRQILLPHG